MATTTNKNHNEEFSRKHEVQVRVLATAVGAIRRNSMTSRYSKHSIPGFVVCEYLVLQVVWDATKGHVLIQRLHSLSESCVTAVHSQH
jgi:hypothetical protein